MIQIVAFDRNRQEREKLRENCWRQISMRKNEDMIFQEAASDQEMNTAVSSKTLLDLLYYEFEKGQQLTGLREFRKKFGGCLLMLITDAAVSPLEYLKPGIAPDSLLLRPFNDSDLAERNREFMLSFLERKEGREGFTIDTRDEKLKIPYSQIYYFEARDKKLYVRTKNEEYAFYGTIDMLEQQLPSGFRRCHRSYIVSVSKIRKIVFSENIIELNDKLAVPVSRSYKSVFKKETS